MLGTAHFGLVVADLEKSLEFYQGILGLELLGMMDREGDDISTIVGFPNTHLKIAFLRLPASGGVTLELIQYVHPKGQPVDTMRCNSGNAHICFRTDDVRSTYAELKARGVQFVSEPVEVLNGINRGACSVYLRDPDGVSMEIIQPAKKPQE